MVKARARARENGVVARARVLEEGAGTEEGAWDSQQADEGGSVWDADEDESAWAVGDMCNTDDEDDDDDDYAGQ